MKDRFLVKKPMTVKEAKELIASLKIHFEEIAKFGSLLEGTNPIDSFDSDGGAILRFNGAEYKLSDLEFINKKNGIHFFIDEDGFACISTDTTYPEKEIGEAETNENEVAQNFVNDFEDALSDYIDYIDYEKFGIDRKKLRGLWEKLANGMTDEEDKDLTSDAKCSSVVHPNHYNSGKYECIEVMREIFGEKAVKLFCTMNAFKYLWRYNKKNGEEDVAKAYNYLKIRSGLNKTEE